MPRSARRSRAVACGALIAGAAPLAALELPTDQVPLIDAPSPQWESADVAVWSHGFVVKLGDKRLLGEALRYDIGHQDLYALGDVVYTMPGARVAARRLGLHLAERSGEAWEVQADVDTPQGLLPIRARKLTLDERVLDFDGVRAGPRYGGLISLGARHIRVYLRRHEAKQRTGPGREVEGVAFIGTWIRVAGVPVLWLPYLYRDFTVEYPWTRYRFGEDSRLGWFARAWIGTSIPPFWGVHASVDARYDIYSRAGKGFGAAAQWRQPTLGRGEFEWFRMHPERVIGTDGDAVEQRDADVIDAEHRAQIPGGALYARWIKLPPPDAPTPGDPVPPSVERFRADYLRDDLEHRPLARRGLTGAWGDGLGTLVLDTERRPSPLATDVDRWWGAQLVVPETEIIGPLHADADGWLEDLHSDPADAKELRLTHRTELRAMQWLDPIGLDGVGLDADGGARGLHVIDRVDSGVEDPDDHHRYVPYADAGVRVRFTARWADDLWNDIVPRVGVELHDRGHGDALPPALVGDARDQLVEDRRYWTASLATSLRGAQEMARIEAIARFAMRDSDRIALDGDGGEHRSATDFVEGEFIATSSPSSWFSISGSGLYDARLAAWQSFDATESWRIHPRVTLTNSTDLLPIDLDRTDVWQETPGVVLRSNRYELGASVSFKPGGALLDRWKLELTRHVVDGTIGMGYEVVRDVDGSIYDRRTSFTIALE